MIVAGKPPAGAQLNRSHPHAQGLVAAWNLAEGAGGVAVESASGIHGSFTGVPVWTPVKDSQAVKFPTTSDYVAVQADTRLDLRSNFSIHARFLYSATNGAVIEKTSNGNINTQWSLFVEGGVLKFRGQSSNTDASSAALTDKTIYDCLATYDNVTLRLYMDAKTTPVGTAAKAGPLSGGNGVARIGSLISFYPNLGGVVFVRVYNWAIPGAMYPSLYAEPHAMFQPVVRRCYSITAAGGGPFPHYTRRAMTGGMVTMGGA